jgi:hypothetical protein
MKLFAIAAALFIPLAGADSGEIGFKKTILDREFRSEGVAVADVNHDGKLDVLAGALWYEAPDWKPHEIAPVQKFQWDGNYSDCFIAAADDVNGDGWADLMVVGFPGAEARWYENPKGAPGHWKKRTLFRSACDETPVFADLLGNGKKVWVFPFQPEGQMAWYEPPTDIDAPFTVHPISAAKAPCTEQFAHGLGVGDVNGDGRRDVLVTAGWWEAPEDRKASPWKFHPAKLGPNCADMIAFDVDGDGVQDVITSSAHGKGIWWFKQVPNPTGADWVQQLTIDESFIQPHAMILADVNRDGLPDLVTGKRFWAHNGNDPGEKETKDYVPICWFEFKRDGGKPSWTRHLIDDGNGVGTQFVVTDLNGDGLLDVVVSNKKGVAVIHQERL